MLLFDSSFSLFGFWNRCDELRATAALDNPLCRLTLSVKLPVAALHDEVDESTTLVTIVAVGHKEHNILYIKGQEVQI